MASIIRDGLRALRRRGRRVRELVAELLAARSGDRVAPTGPLSRTEFLQLFSLDEVAQKLAGDDIAGAEAVLLAHYERRVQEDWLQPPPEITDLRLRLTGLEDKELLAVAERVLDYQITTTADKPRVDSDGVIDWVHNPTPDHEWILKINRHAWWVVLGLAYERTGEERFAETFVRQMLDWTTKNPPIPRKNEKSATWRLMEVGMRMRVSWIPAFGFFHNAPSFTAAAKLQMLRSICDHGRFLALFKTNRNHLLREANGLVHVAVLFPEFREAGGWQRIALERIEGALKEQVNEDGQQVEMSTAYQWLVIDEFERIFDLLEAYGLSLPNEDLSSWLVRMYRVLAHVVLPDGTMPQINDGFVLWPSSRLAEAGKRLQRDDLIHVGTGGREGTTPEATSTLIRDGGLAVMRSDWTPEARYLLFDSGPHGGFHGHEDKLSLEVYAHGQRYIVDPGTYTYDPSDPFRDYFVGSQGHNTVMVDGGSQVRFWNQAYRNPVPVEGNYATWKSTDVFDYVRASYDEGYAPFARRPPPDVKITDDVRHTRSVLFVKPDYWLVLDELVARDAHTYEWLFHAAPQIRIDVGAGGRATMCRDDLGPRLEVVPVGTNSLSSRTVRGEEDPIQGWFSPDHHSKEPATTLLYHCSNARSVRQAFVLYPFEAGSPASVTVEPLEVSGTRAFGVAVTGPRGKDCLVISSEAGQKTFQGYETRGAVAGVRIDPGGAVRERFDWDGPDS